MTEDINLETFKTLTYETNPSVSVGSTKAFIFLGNSGNGIGVTGFSGITSLTNGSTSNEVYFSSTSTETSSQPENGRLKNIIFSLGKYFAVDN